MSSLTERRRSSLLGQLGKAQTKISALEEFIRDRERQFHTAVTRLERNESRGGPSGRLRRVGLSHDLLRMHSMSSTEDGSEDIDTAIAFAQPLKDYVVLKITRVLDSSDPDQPTPFILRRLISREYHIGPEGVVIGSSPAATVCLPSGAEVWDRHVEIKWNEREDANPQIGATNTRCGSKLVKQDEIETPNHPSGHFILCDCTEGQGTFYLSSNSQDIQHSTILEQSDPSIDQNESNLTPRDNLPDSLSRTYQIPLTHGVCFIAGQLEFTVTSPPLPLLLTLRMFAAARRGDLEDLKSILELSVYAGVTSPHVMVTPTKNKELNRYSTVSIVSEEGLDVNVEYQAPSYSDDSIFSYSQALGRRRSSVPVPRLVLPMSPSSPVLATHASAQIKVSHRLLLHIAIENRNEEMVKYLLEKGANVNLCSGELNQNALHLAALRNLDEIVVELLRYGGDIEIRDSRHFQPLALTTSYDIRKLLLGAVLLCAASEAGDMSEVVRLVSTSYISSNARGLRHKNALHLACARGHKDTAEFLILNGANVNSKGGSRQRTPLHYASLKNNVEVAMLLLESGANEFARDSNGYTPLNLSMGGDMCKLLHKEPLSLCLAAQSGDVESVRSILVECEGSGEVESDRERLVDQRNQQSHAPLHLACTTGNITIAKLLVAHGADLNLQGGSDSWTPIFYAAMAGHEQMVEFLLSVGASTEIVDAQEQTVQECVEKAIEESSDRLTKLEKSGRLESVIETGTLHTLEPASMNRQESASSCSIDGEKTWLSTRYKQLKLVSQLLTSGPERLLKAIESKNLQEFVSLLESSTVDPNALVDKHCPCSALMRVCEEGLIEFVRVLIKHGANVNVAGLSKQIPLLAAAGAGRADIVQLLIENGADVTIQGVDTKSTALHEAASSNSLDTVEYLLTVPWVGVDKENTSGETPFDCCSLIEIRKLLASGTNRLLIAASIGDDEQIRELVQKNTISPSHEFKLGLTALHEACDAGHLSTTELLVELGADVNKQAHVSQLSPLHIASQNNSIDIAHVLLQAGAKLDLKDNEGKVPFEVAFTNQMRKVLVEARTLRAQPVSFGRVSSSNEKKCMICMDNVINTIILPCGHQAFCTMCVSRINVCALDRQAIREVITVYK